VLVWPCQAHPDPDQRRRHALLLAFVIISEPESPRQRCFGWSRPVLIAQLSVPAAIVPGRPRCHLTGGAPNP
jgi:hypothetical protein